MLSTLCKLPLKPSQQTSRVDTTVRPPQAGERPAQDRSAGTHVGTGLESRCAGSDVSLYRCCAWSAFLDKDKPEKALAPGGTALPGGVLIRWTQNEI